MKEPTSSNGPPRDDHGRPHAAALPAHKVRLSAAERARLRAYGPWAVVTGASEGIGRALASDLAAADEGQRTMKASPEPSIAIQPNPAHDQPNPTYTNL